jgi:MinD-like ATPase involved in chromosome partitioning or flagellar assembly
MSFYRHLWRSLKASPARKVVEQAMDQKNNVGIRTPFDLLEAVERIDSASGRFLKEQALQFRPRLVVNQLRYPEDERLGHSMAVVCRKHLGIDIESLGAVGFDESVWRANRKKRPFMLDFPESSAGRSLEQIARALLLTVPRPARTN